MNEYGFSQGIARNATESEYPGLWRGLVGLWSPSVGVQGARVVDFARGNHGAISGPAWSTARRQGSSLGYSGNSVSISDSTALQLVGTPFSVSAWVMPTSLHDYGNVVSKAASNESAGWGILTLANGDWHWQWKSAGVSDVTAGAGCLANNVWAHIAAVYDGAAMRLYTNGRLSSSDTINGIISSTSALLIGTNIGSTRTFTGRIGDMAIHRRPLATSELLQICQGASPLVRRQEAVAYRASGGGGGPTFKPAWARRGFNLGTGIAA